MTLATIDATVPTTDSHGQPIRLLSADDLKLIRKADDACLDIQHGEGAIRLFIRPNDRNQIEARLDGFPINVTDYDAGYTYGGTEQQRSYRAYVYVNSCRYNDAWRTFALLAKVGDRVTFVGIKDNNNGNLRDVGYHHDELWLEIRRGKQTFRLFIHAQVGPDNSARMFRSSTS